MKKISFRHDPETGRLSEKDTKKYFSTIGFAVFSLVVVSVAASFGVSFLIGAVAPKLFDNTIIRNIISIVCQYGIALPVAMIFLRKLPRDVNPSEPLGVKNWIGCLFLTFTFMSIGSYVSQYIIMFFESMLNRTLVNPVADSTVGNHWILNLIFVAIIPPIIEELVFRKLICDRLLPLGEGYAVVLSALIFGAIHGNFFQFFYAFLLGLLFSAIYVKTGRIRYTIIYHAIINGLGGVFIPWLIEKLEPVLSDTELLSNAMDALQSGNEAAIEELSGILAPYMPYVVMYGAYSVFELLAAFAGVFLLSGYLRKFKFRSGLLLPAKEGRIANVFCNVGVAAAVTSFVGLFLLSFI